MTDPQQSSRLAVCMDSGAADAVQRELRAAGVDNAASVPVRTPEDVTAVLEQLLAGVWIVADVEDLTLAADLHDQGRRVGVAEWYDDHRRPVTDGLSDEQVGLLLDIRRGADIERAARAVHLSPRTAARRLNDARHTLRARSTAEAVARVGRRIDELSG
jgi:DNA-binding NarL/FixJ family response regulator